MARSVVVVLKSTSILLLLMYLFVCSSSSSFASGIEIGGRGRKVGGWMKIKDVKTNDEVQEIGKFAVREFNMMQENDKQGSGDGVIFSEVIEGKKQVVSGIKYNLKIAGVQSGVARIFDAVVVVKSWVSSKELISFAPSTSS